MDNQRPNPDELLEQIRKEEKAKAGGKLKIFFGYAAGVGKTYAMLEAAREQASCRCGYCYRVCSAAREA